MAATIITAPSEVVYPTAKPITYRERRNDMTSLNEQIVFFNGTYKKWAKDNNLADIITSTSTSTSPPSTPPKTYSLMHEPPHVSRHKSRTSKNPILEDEPTLPLPSTSKCSRRLFTRELAIRPSTSQGPQAEKAIYDAVAVETLADSLDLNNLPDALFIEEDSDGDMVEIRFIPDVNPSTDSLFKIKRVKLAPIIEIPE